MTAFLTKTAALEILKNCECTAILDMEGRFAVIRDKNMESFGSIDVATFDAIHNSSKRFHIHEEDKRRILYHEDNKKMMKKISKEQTLPEGAVIFPEENFILMNAKGDSRKQSDNFMRRLVANNKALEVGDGAIFSRNSKNDDEYFIAPYIEISNPNDLKWYMSLNHHKINYAWIGMTFEQAVEKLLNA